MAQSPQKKLTRTPMDDSNMNRKETEVRDVPCSIWKSSRR